MLTKLKLMDQTCTKDKGNGYQTETSEILDTSHVVLFQYVFGNIKIIIKHLTYNDTLRQLFPKLLNNQKFNCFQDSVHDI